MAIFEFKLPDLGEGVLEGEIVAWLVKPGDVVKEDQNVVEVMTDKATISVPTPKGGKVLKTHGAVGEVVRSSELGEERILEAVAGAAGGGIAVVHEHDSRPREGAAEVVHGRFDAGVAAQDHLVAGRGGAGEDLLDLEPV